MSPKSQKPWIVLKFGGTSVSTKECWQTIANAIQSRHGEGFQVLAVCSALSQVSNRLESALRKAEAGGDTSADLASLKLQHEELAADLQVGSEGLEEWLDDLSSLIEGVRLTGEATPKITARVLSVGEMMSTKLGAAFLDKQIGGAQWLDARAILEADPVPLTLDPSGRSYLSATCTNDPDPALQDSLAQSGHGVFVTQGFVASRDGETVLLGRGGSDTSGAYFAGLLEAERLEIWTDVPGMLTTNPHVVEEARLLRRLPYRVAEELAMRGAKVLHPGAIRAAERAQVPIQVRWTKRPELSGTEIRDAEPGPPSVKAVSSRESMVAVSMRVDTDWQPIGLIADLASCFKDHGLSIDLLASSPTNLTVALDLRANHCTRADLGPLFEDLEKLSRPRLIDSLASISLVGEGIRALLHHWGEALHCFEDEEVILLSQAANDRSISFLVTETAADRLVKDLHSHLFPADSDRDDLGSTWKDLMAGDSGTQRSLDGSRESVAAMAAC